MKLYQITGLFPEVLLDGGWIEAFQKGLNTKPSESCMGALIKVTPSVCICVLERL